MVIKGAFGSTNGSRRSTAVLLLSVLSLLVVGEGGRGASVETLNIENGVPTAVFVTTAEGTVVHIYVHGMCTYVGMNYGRIKKKKKKKRRVEGRTKTCAPQAYLKRFVRCPSYKHIT